jgi:hypothetical protein
MRRFFVPILYRRVAFEAFYNFSDFVESITCEDKKPVRFVVRIHAGEPFSIHSSVSLEQGARDGTKLFDL